MPRMSRRPYGIDVSQWNADRYGTPNIRTFHGYDFVIVRITSGDGGLHTDDLAAFYTNLARKQMVPFGGYHFAANEGGSASRQAAYFFDHAERLGVGIMHRGNVGLVIDGEGSLDASLCSGIIRETQKLTRTKPRPEVGLYSGGWIKGHGGSTLGADWGWLAQWGPTPERPLGWSRAFLRFWQFTSVPLDRDCYMGTHKAFARWLMENPKERRP